MKGCHPDPHSRQMKVSRCYSKKCVQNAATGYGQLVPAAGRVCLPPAVECKCSYAQLGSCSLCKSITAASRRLGGFCCTAHVAIRERWVGTSPACASLHPPCWLLWPLCGTERRSPCTAATSAVDVKGAKSNVSGWAALAVPTALAIVSSVCPLSCPANSHARLSTSSSSSFIIIIIIIIYA